MKRWAKRILIVLVALVVLAGAGVGALVYFAGQTGSGTIEKWIASQIQTIANSYINPKLTFDHLDYEYPGTVKLKNLKLTADDPRHPGKTLDILGAAGATVTLGEIPSIGKPIVIEKIVLDQPLFQAIATGPGEPTFIGFTGMVKQGVIKEATTPKSETQTKLSQIFEMRLVELVGGKIVYDPLLKGTQPMVLDEINTRLDVIPTDAGEYTLKMGFDRKPVFSLDIDLKLNIDTMYASDVKINLWASLSSANRQYLPPQAQKMLADHEVRGEMSVRVRGELPLTAYQKGSVLTTVQLTDANIKVGEYRLPIEQLDLQVKLHQGKLLLPVLKIEALHGELVAGGEMTLNDSLDSILALQVTRMQLEELFVNPDNPEDPKLAGRLNAGVNTVVPLAALIPRLGSASVPPSTPPLPKKWGEGMLKLDKARLVKVPVLDDITNLLTGAKKVKISKNESAEAEFTFGDDKIRIADFRYKGELVGARGAGTISLDRRLDLVVNGGPVERVQALFGKSVGDAFGAFTDKLVTYLVTGDLDQPIIKAKFGGGVAQKVGEGVVEGAKDIGKGAGDLFKGIFDRK